MNRKEYSAGAVKHAFWFMEFRKVVALRLAGNSWEEIKQLSENENIFGAPTRTRAIQIFNTVSARVKSLDDSFYPIFEACDLASQKLFALLAAMTYDVLFGELVYELVREKMIIGSNELADSDLRIFFKGKQQQSEKVAKWTEATIKKLMMVLINEPTFMVTAPSALAAASVAYSMPAVLPCRSVRNRLEKSIPPKTIPMGGMMTSSTSDFTSPENAVPTTMPTAKSITLPRMIKSLNSCLIDIYCLMQFEKRGIIQKNARWCDCKFLWQTVIAVGQTRKRQPETDSGCLCHTLKRD